MNDDLRHGDDPGSAGLDSGDRAVVASLERYGPGQIAATPPWPALDGAIRRDRRVRRMRAASGALAVLASLALVLPFTPVRLEPLDELAASIGWRDRASRDQSDRSDRSDRAPDQRSTQLIQDVDDSAGDYRELDGGNAPAPQVKAGSFPAWAAAAWRDAVVGASLLATGTDAEDSGPAKGEAYAAVDDGTARRLVVRLFKKANDRVTWGCATMVGPSGAKASQMRLGRLFVSDPRYVQLAGPFDATHAGGLVAVCDRDADAVEVAAAPTIGADGSVTVTWLTVPRVGQDGVWLADLGAAGSGALVYRMNRGDRVTHGALIGPGAVGPDGFGPLNSMDNLAFAEVIPPTLEDIWMPKVHYAQRLGQYAGLTPRSGTGLAGASRLLTYSTDPAKSPEAPTRKATVRVAALRSAAGGWAATGSLNVWAKRDGYQGTDLPFHLVAGPATESGAPPMLGFAVQSDDPILDHTVIVWAPPGVTSVAVPATENRAQVVDGIAWIEGLKPGAWQESSPGQAMLVEGYDAAGQLIARTRVDAGGWSTAHSSAHDRVIWPTTSQP
jgi:hypothetical protein